MSKITSQANGPAFSADIRAKLHTSRGQEYWRSLDQLADTAEFREWLDREFPRGASELVDPVSRRTFLKLMGASLALGGLTGCLKPPQEYVAPYANAPLEQRPGIPNFYATALSLDGYGLGVVVKSNEGRPTKVEGNPRHPASLGATSIYEQAELLNLYDPDRPEAPLNRGNIDTWDNFSAEFNEVIQVQRAFNGAGLRILTETITSPTMADQLAQILAAFPAARWVQYSPVGTSNTLNGARLAFGEYAEARYRFENARVVVALDADFLTEGPGRVRYARDCMNARRVLGDQTAMNRLYAVEPVLSNTGIVADNRLPVRAAEIEAVARYIAVQVGVATEAPAEVPDQVFLDALVADLQDNAGGSLVIVGENQPPFVHALGHAINDALGNIGRTVELSDPVVAAPSDQTAELARLATELRAGDIDVLLMIGTNPAYAAPADLRFAEAIGQAEFSVSLNTYVDETAVLADWFIPMTHPLESWGDVRAFDGTVSIVQPLIEPLYVQDRSPLELLSLVLGQPVTDYDALRAYWQNTSGLEEAAFDSFFNQALIDGVVAETTLPARQLTLDTAFLSQPLAEAAEGFELIFRPDATIYDGRFANNGWLQELPKPTTKLTWDNAALISPRTAITLFNLGFNPDELTDGDLEALDRVNGRLLQLNYRGGSLTMPVWVAPGHAEGTVTINLGYGRTRTGRVGEGTGFNAYILRTSDAPYFGAGLEAVATNGMYQLVSTQAHHSLQGRDIVRAGNIEAFRENPKSIAEEVYTHEYGNVGKPEYQSFFSEEFAYPKNAWGMAIDLTTCIGCNACTIACQAENNIPIVGKAEVARGREMHWIRIDRYFRGNVDNPQTYVQPLTCMHCEQAPCEIVCPVAATVHDDEGINNMVYNRCVGTKYCSNNCPYKVRRFNFFQYQDLETPQVFLLNNPDVTVRNRGVMEKCSYCVQRISAARITAKRENREIADGEVITACQQVCPTQAIVFGDTAKADSVVSQFKAQPQNYVLLEILNTKPRTSYLARLRNPNLALASEDDAHHGAEG